MTRDLDLSDELWRSEDCKDQERDPPRRRAAAPGVGLRVGCWDLANTVLSLGSGWKDAPL